MSATFFAHPSPSGIHHSFSTAQTCLRLQPTCVQYPPCLASTSPEQTSAIQIIADDTVQTPPYVRKIKKAYK